MCADQNILDVERDKCVERVRELCHDIGCSGVSRSCKTDPHHCTIIQKIFDRYKPPMKVKT